MLDKLACEIEEDDTGYHAAVIDVGDDSVLYVSDSFFRMEDAERAASEWIERNR